MIIRDLDRKQLRSIGE